MKIVILDGHTLNPGDLSWSPLEDLGDVVVYDRTSSESLVERAMGADLLLTNKTQLRADTLKQLPNLKYIGVLATGYDVVDVAEAAVRGIPVTNVPAYGTASVAQFVFALLLELCHRCGMHSDASRGGEWAGSADFCFWKSDLVELSGKTLGIVGLGRIGEQVATIAPAFGMNVVAHTRSRKSSPVEGMSIVELDELLAVSDVVSLHCPLTPETKHMIDSSALRRMKRSAFLINTARGMLINEQDLADALNHGTIAGAALDVLSVEPPPADHPLLRAANCIVTPHIAWATREARSRLLDTAVDNVRAFINGTPENVVNEMPRR
ncbi:D-2-hydroxyacid dehydrogenase [Paenibacillus alkalitolerans]|uniref:D-2-hydroxyacid dehydrogenase n=1 Tax=Paenibacillus alkalitolerans TaxID=2799335 RepID=UPI0018F66889|nr:D-2-hydroxyacid dehydrogenase [Paenibacillus alkalitolerans]